MVYVNFIDKRSFKAKVICTLIFCFLTAIGLALLLPYSVKKHPILVAFGFVSFALTCFVIILLLCIAGLMTIYQLRKHHPDIWKNSINSSRNTRYEAIRQRKYIDDPCLTKISVCTTKIGIYCFVIWLILFLVALCVILTVGDDSFVKFIFGE